MTTTGTRVERQIRQAMAVEPVPPYVRTMSGAFYLRQVGQFAKAVEECARALQEDPLNLLWRMHLPAMCLHTAGRTEEAIQQLQKMIEIDEGYYLTYATLCLIEAARGNHAQALAYAGRLNALVPWWFFGGPLLAGLIAPRGDASRTESLMTPFSDHNAYGAPMAAMAWALFYIVQSDIETAAEWMEKAIAAARHARADFRVRVLQVQSACPAWRE